MKKLTLVLAIFPLLTGCASLSGRVLKETKEGESIESITQKLGQPTEFKTLESIPGAYVYTYRSGGDICEFYFMDGSVLFRDCKKDASYVSPLRIIGKAMQGMGDGMASSSGNNSARPLNCTTTALHGQGLSTYNTNCN
jgi:hypothetical protein